MSYTNADGLLVLTNGDQGVPKNLGQAVAGETKTLVFNLEDAALLPASPAAPAANDAFIPAGAYITNAYTIVKTAFTGTNAVLNIGLQTAAGVAIDADGIDAAVAVAALGANKAVANDGALVGGTATVGAANAYLSIDYDTAAFTAGAAKIVIEYIVV
jgi:hypothetical protein